MIIVACGGLGLALAAWMFFLASLTPQPAQKALIFTVVGVLSGLVMAGVGLVGRSQVLTGGRSGDGFSTAIGQSVFENFTSNGS